MFLITGLLSQLDYKFWTNEVNAKERLPMIVGQDERGLCVAVEDCFCKGLPVDEEKMVCDLEGAIMEGALKKILNRTVSVREVKCNVHGDERCEYEVRLQ
ncbi:4-vinyl reductase [Paenibacillus yonginensis]|uniref:4-vinyl reductase n=1 Tax=Paenibacillus yonginensis TaxID=1462996 RepID=UPI001F377797|nr:4-vinyl reductase [Paenibacillus yonginensis]